MLCLWTSSINVEAFEPWVVCVSENLKTGAPVPRSRLAVHLALGILELSKDGHRDASYPVFLLPSWNWCLEAVATNPN